MEVQFHLNWEQAFEHWITKAAHSLQEYCEQHLEMNPRFWYRIPRTHIEEFIIFNSLMIALFLILAANYSRGVKGKKVEKPKTKIPTFSDKIFGYIFVGFYLMQVFVKGSRVYAHLAYLLMPCHVYTLFLIYCLLSKNKQIVDWIFTVVIVTFSWFPMMALLFPDFTDQHWSFEPALYYIHHIFIWAAPFYLSTQKDRFTILPNSLPVICWILIFGIVLQFDIQTVASYYSGINVNFQLYPPSLPEALDFMHGRDYRVKFFIALFFIGLLKKSAIERFGNLMVGFGLGTRGPLEHGHDSKKRK